MWAEGPGGVPFGWVAPKPPWGAAPRCPACPAGVPISPEKWGERGPGPLSSVGGSVGTVAGWTLRRGFPADSGGGARLSLEKVGGKNTRGKPLDPGFYGPLAVARSFWGSLSLVRSRGYFLRYAKTDLGRIFEGKYAEKHFGERRFPNQAHPPKAFPLGGRCPSAHTGADEGAISYPTFPCRKSERLSPVAPTEFFSCPVGQVDRPLISHLR